MNAKVIWYLKLYDMNQGKKFGDGMITLTGYFLVSRSKCPFQTVLSKRLIVWGLQLAET